MAAVEPALQLVHPEQADDRRSPSLSRAVLASSGGRIGVSLGVLLILLIAFGRFFTPFDPDAVGVGVPVTGPSSSHLLGVDSLGRDVLSRFLVGGGSILLVPLVAVILAFLLGGSLGMF